VTDRFDAVIVGLGAMGSAACCELARRGMSVLGFDRFTSPHAHGSSHGDTRIIREAYYEHPLYVPLIQRAYEAWRELEQRVDRSLLRVTGGLMIGPRDGELVSGARRSAELHRLPHEEMDAAEVSRRFPALRPDAHMVGLYEPRAGILYPELCITSFLELAAAHGGRLRYEEPVLDWRADGAGVSVRTAQARYEASTLVLSVGAWLPSLLRPRRVPLTIERQVLHWFAPRVARHLDPHCCPIFMFEYQPRRFCYGFPLHHGAVKAALHHDGRPTDPDEVEDVEPGEVEHIRRLLERYLPDAGGRCLRSATCIYTNTPDRHFLLDVHPDHANVLLVSPCSGHGFKFASVIGEIVADLIEEGRSQFDIVPFGFDRFGPDATDSQVRRPVAGEFTP